MGFSCCGTQPNRQPIILSTEKRKMKDAVGRTYTMRKRSCIIIGIIRYSLESGGYVSRGLMGLDGEANFYAYVPDVNS